MAWWVEWNDYVLNSVNECDGNAPRGVDEWIGWREWRGMKRERLAWEWMHVRCEWMKGMKKANEFWWLIWALGVRMITIGHRICRQSICVVTIYLMIMACVVDFSNGITFTTSLISWHFCHPFLRASFFLIPGDWAIIISNSPLLTFQMFLKYFFLYLWNWKIFLMLIMMEKTIRKEEAQEGKQQTPELTYLIHLIVSDPMSHRPLQYFNTSFLV